ncbi:unnamed protein product [Vicia faba]|uniref:Uncharacterized protein n=1 Tax=Vicia faba TaxID=3906 RepID=A0AAV0Z5V9_VICFA|nr:unnamed protein product [Vicia faba]
MLLLFVASSTSHSIGFHSGDSALCMEIHKNQGLRSSIYVAITTWIGVLAIQVSPAAVSPSSDGIDGLSPAELQSRIQLVFEFVVKDADVGQILKDIKHLLEDACVLEDAHDTSIQDSTAVTPHDVPPSDIPCDKKDNSEDAGSVAEKELISSQEPTQYIQINSDVEAAISQIHDFVLFLDKKTLALHQLKYKFSPVSN